MQRNFVITILYVGQVITGLGQSMIWVAQGEYISLCATDDTRGFYFGLFWSIYMSSQIFGNFTGAIIITRASGPTFFLIMGAIMFIGALLNIFLKKPKPFCNIHGEYLHKHHEPESFTTIL